MATTKQQYAGASEIDVEKKVVLPGGRSSADADADAVNKVNYDETRSVSDDGLTALPKGTFDPVYEAKARVLNEAIQEIGMGWYQWQLFIVVGFGWAADQLWPTAGGLTYPSLVNEFKPSKGPTWQLAGNIGILFGALFWGFSSDIIGRRYAFNITLAITGVFGMVAASSTNWVMVCSFKALWYFGVGGNLPVDSALFIEFLPKSHQYLLTILSVDWSLASLLANLVAWPILGNLTCPQKAACVRKDNMGWRYFLIAMGGVTFTMFAIRFFFFTIFESPKFLMGKGKDEEAVRVVHEVARRNGKTSNLTLADLKACEPEGYVAQTDAVAITKRRLEVVKFTRVRDLFHGRKLAWSTTLLILIWGFIGLAYPLYNGFVTYLLAQKGANFGKSSPSITYRNSTIIAAMGVPGALIGAFLTEQPRIGRKGALAFAILASGVFLFLTTTAKTLNAYLGFNCGWSVFSTMMYSILYSYTPELFPTSHRGTGNALTASSNRLFSVFSPVIAMYANLNTPVPVYVAGALFFAAGLLVILLPFESRGKAALGGTWRGLLLTLSSTHKVRPDLLTVKELHLKGLVELDVPGPEQVVTFYNLATGEEDEASVFSAHNYVHFPSRQGLPCMMNYSKVSAADGFEHAAKVIKDPWWHDQEEQGDEGGFVWSIKASAFGDPTFVQHMRESHGLEFDGNENQGSGEAV